MNYTLLDTENYFEQAEALHAVLTLWHGGQASKTYSLLCQSQFKLGMAWSESQVEEENSYFSQIEAWAEDNDDEKLETLMTEINHYLDTKGGLDI